MHNNYNENLAALPANTLHDVPPKTMALINDYLYHFLLHKATQIKIQTQNKRKKGKN